MVLVIADLIYYPFIYYSPEFICKPCCFVSDRRNFIYYPILCIIWTRTKRTRPVHVLETSNSETCMPSLGAGISVSTACELVVRWLDDEG